MAKSFTEIPVSTPETPTLDLVNEPKDLRDLNESQLETLADELREFLLFSVGQTGGHFGAGLGVVELTIALHYIFNTPDDRIVWDVGHQTYPHKIITGRRNKMDTMRQEGGLSGFPKRSESEYDTFGVGHSSTSISAALGMTLASDHQKNPRKTVAVIGDGAMTAGMAFEAINHASHVDKDLLVILNDNQMSISKNTGGLSTYFSKLWASRFYTQLRETGKKALKSLPQTKEFVRKTEEYMKSMVSPATIFEELGFYYIGPLDGHDLPLITSTLRKLKNIKGPVMLHVITQKGKGFSPAEGWLCDMAEQDDRLIGITPAMCEGSGMNTFAEKFPDRFEDVAIAEQHAVTLAAGMACERIKPVVAIYSTFLQRAYDQLIHDVAVQNLDVLFALDRAGLVGQDGATHAGAYDISYLRCIPNMIIMTPSDENETRQLLYTGFMHSGPAAVRYPRGSGPGANIQQEMKQIPIGKGNTLRHGTNVAILNFGTLLHSVFDLSEELDTTLIDMRFVKPLDKALLIDTASKHKLIVTIEENSIAGGAGSAVSEFLNSEGMTIPILQLGLPDIFIDHADPKDQLASVGLDPKGIKASISNRMKILNIDFIKPVLKESNL